MLPYANVDDTEANLLVAVAICEAFVESNIIILRPEVIEGLTEPFTVFHVDRITEGIQYFVGFDGEHDLDGKTFNPMGMEPQVLGVQLTDSRLTLADALSVQESKTALRAAHILMITQHGGLLSTDEQPKDPKSLEWTVNLEEYTEPVTCSHVATIEHDDDTYCCYIGKGQKKNGDTEHFLLIVQLIGGEFFSVDTDNNELWGALLKALLEQFGIGTDDGSGDDYDSELDESDDGVDPNDPDKYFN